MDKTTQVIKPDDVRAMRGADSPVNIKLTRVVTRERCGADLLFGIAELDAGERSRWFSYEESDPRSEEVAYYGPVEQAYYVTDGTLGVAWADGELTTSSGEVLYLAPGKSYQLFAAGDGPVKAIYAMVPTPE